MGARVGSLDGKGFVAAWISRRLARAREDAERADGTLNTLMGGVGKLLVAELGKYESMPVACWMDAVREALSL